MGLATAKALQPLGYKVSGWSRTPPSGPQQQQEREGVPTYVGQQQLQEFVSQQDALVCLLPLTQETTGRMLDGCQCCRTCEGRLGGLTLMILTSKSMLLSQNTV
jgi:phosphoglycerate dehydrogenase-like enzyme